MDPGYDKENRDLLEKNLKYLNIPAKIFDSDVFEISEKISGDYPCYMCARMRRGFLYAKAKELGCNKVALGHHKDDALETFLLSICYEGRINCFSPKSYMDKNNLFLIRPMVYINESSIRKFALNNKLPIIKNPCPADGKTKRQDMKELIKDLDRKISDMKDKTKDFNKKVMYLLVNEGELSTFGPGGRFGGLVFDTLGFKPADKKVSKSPHGQNINNEYINKQNPDVILAMDRGSVVGGKATTNQVLKNKVIKNVKAVKSNHIYELDPKLWYFSSGSSTTTIKQIDELNEVVEKVEK